MQGWIKTVVWLVGQGELAGLSLYFMLIAVYLQQPEKDAFVMQTAFIVRGRSRMQ